ncbi:MAG: (d)CMP kinase [Candidatus Omnitrophota bacterium]|nr:(d)CMP kinase [Candidatus Omnitrophota bacterium]MBU1928967.1 (d)CMP kinase [Candidatus Omnitrophota bacterium]MBU2035724.1 (d)CMP kinase [Candidatus Omnitrophota bacterium]MBU2257625.1 (d)CMP kinase [Candidatus Omnitrophota bacterium]
MIIAIDGPAGAGKSTVAKILARRLGFLYIDTGAMYRALTLKALEEEIDPGDTAGIVKLANRVRIELKYKRLCGLNVFIDGTNVSKGIRQPNITKIVSDIAKIKGVRKVMLGLQRRMGESNNSVLEGRDIGTVVFPDAQKKFFLDARFNERVNRRYKELKVTKLKDITVNNVARDLSNRDTIDSTRKIAPLKKAKDAIYIDTTNMSVNKVVKTLLSHIKNRVDQSIGFAN